MLTAWHWACHRVHFVRCHFSSSLPFPWGSQGNVCVFVGLQWFSLLDFFFYLQKVRSMALDDVVILNVDTNTLETPFDDLQSLPNDVVGNELLHSDSQELLQWTWTCLWRDCCGFPVAWEPQLVFVTTSGTFVSVKEVGGWFTFLVLYCSHNPHLKWPQGLDSLSSWGVRGSCHPHCHCHVQRTEQPPQVTPPKASRRASVWAIWGTSSLHFFLVPLSNPAISHVAEYLLPVFWMWLHVP